MTKSSLPRGNMFIVSFYLWNVRHSHKVTVFFLILVWSWLCRSSWTCYFFENTGHFIMRSGITKIYYRKTIGHVFTKPVQIEGTAQQCSHHSSHFCRYAMGVYVVRKWPLRGRSRFICWNITRVSPWLLCNLYFLQSTERTRLKTRPFVRGINSLLKMGVCALRNQVVAHLTAEDGVERLSGQFSV